MLNVVSNLNHAHWHFELVEDIDHEIRIPRYLHYTQGPDSCDAEADSESDINVDE